MYKVLIVDERFKRQEDNYIHLEWEKYDLGVCDKVVIKDAYEAIKFHNPDIIILNNNDYSLKTVYIYNPLGYLMSH